MFENAQESATLEKSLQSIQHLAFLAAHYKLSDLFDFIILSLVRMSGLAKSGRTIPSEIDVLKEVSADEQKKRKADIWSVDFGQSFKAQVSAVTLCNLLKDYAEISITGWGHLASILSNCFLHQILPLGLLTTDVFPAGKITVSRLVALSGSDSIGESPKKEQGLFSSFAQFLSLSSEVEDDINDPQFIAGLNSAISAIEFCKFEELLDETRFMEETTVLKIMNAFISASREDAQADSSSLSGFSQSSAFFLENLFRIVLKNRDRLKALWPPLCSHLEQIMQPSSPVVLIERACVSIIKLLLRITHTVLPLLILGRIAG